MKNNDVLVRIENLVKYFPIRKGFIKKSVDYVKAVDDVSFTIHRGETLGLVGESGCGKTTVGRTVIRLYEPTSGKIILDGEDITNLSTSQLMPYRKRMQMIFQDPYASLNPRLTVGDIVKEALDIHEIGTPAMREEKVHQLLDEVGLNPDHASRYPHEFSGGQRQRIGIARSLAVEPEFIVCDEPISALDVSIQAQVVNMLEDLQESYGLTYLFIAHDLSMVRHISDRTGVMYLGKFVELAESDEIYLHPQHPYTKALLSSIPVPDPKTSRTMKRIMLEGDVPSPLNPPSGCRFRTRCQYAMDICTVEDPEFKEVQPGHWCACHLYD